MLQKGSTCSGDGKIFVYDVEDLSNHTIRLCPMADYVGTSGFLMQSGRKNILTSANIK